MSNTVDVSETPNSVVVVESDNTVSVMQVSNAVTVASPGPAGPDELSELQDVALSSPAAGEVLTYNGTTWENADYAPVAFPRYLVQSTALWFGSASTATGNPANVMPPTNSLVFAPIIIPTDCIADGIAIYVGVASATSTIRLGIYSDSDGVPDSLVVDAGTVTGSTTGAKTLSITDESLTAGRWWIAIGGDDNLSRLFCDLGVATWLGYKTARIGIVTLANHWRQSYTPGTLPATATPYLSEAISRPVGWLSLRTA